MNSLNITNNTMIDETKNRISIQINNTKVSRVLSYLLISAAQFRRRLILRKVNIPSNTQFLDKDEYPIFVKDLFKINNIRKENHS